MRSYMKIKPSRNVRKTTTLSFTDIGKSCPICKFLMSKNMSFYAIRENFQIYIRCKLRLIVPSVLKQCYQIRRGQFCHRDSYS